MPEASRRPVMDEAIAEDLLASRGGKWTIAVVLQLRRQTLRFSELKREMGTISQKTLAETLKQLERDGFVSRTAFAVIPPRVDYALTELGQAALTVFEAWEDFAHEHWGEVVAARQRFDALGGRHT